MKAVGVPDDPWERRRRTYYPEWSNDRPEPELHVTDNPVVAELLGPDGKPIRQWRQRPPFGFQRPEQKR